MSPLGRDITCYLSNTTVEERYDQHCYICLGNELYYTEKSLQAYRRLWLISECAYKFKR